MSENGSKNERKRDDQGKFVKGKAGGPGRGNKSKLEIDFDSLTDLGAAEALIKIDMADKDHKIRQKAVSEWLRLMRFKSTTSKEKDGTPSEFERKLLNVLSALACEGGSIDEVLDLMLVKCLACPHLGLKRYDSEELLPPDDEDDIFFDADTEAGGQ